jgi:hypothetical protein
MRTTTALRIVPLFLLLPALVQAQTDTTQTAKKDSIPKVVFGGYVDAYYAFYTDSVGDGNFQKFPTVSPRSELGLNVALLTAQYDADKVRGMVALQYGDIPASAWDPTFNNILEAHAGVRLCTKLWLDAGYFRTYLGTEGLYPKENIASSLSLNTWHQPYFESGARLVYSPTDKWTLNLYVLNGYNRYVDNNSKKSLGLLATYSLGDKGNINYANYTGDDTPTAADSISHMRIYNNFYINYTIKKLKLQFGADYCIQQHSGLDDADATATMFSGVFALKYQCKKGFAVYAREEWFNDPDAFMGGVFADKNGELTGLNLTGTTAGLEIKPTPDTYVRLEGRQLMMDPDLQIFRTDHDNTSNRTEVMLNMGITF